MHESEIKKHICNNTIKIIVKPNSPKNEITKWDAEKKALRINIAAVPEKDKANKEIIKYFSKLLKKKITIKKGKKTREKILQISA